MPVSQVTAVSFLSLLYEDTQPSTMSSRRYDPYEAMNAEVDEEEELRQYDFAEALGTVILDGSDVKVTEANKYLIDDTSDIITEKSEVKPSYDHIRYHATIAAPLDDYKRGIVLVRGENMSIAHAKAADVNENNMVVGEARKHQDLIGTINGTFSTNIGLPMEVQIPVENAPGFVSYDSQFATALVNTDPNMSEGPSSFKLLENRLTERGLMHLMKNVGVARNSIKTNDIISGRNNRGALVVKSDSPVIRSIFEFIDEKRQDGTDPIIEIRDKDGAISEIVVREPEEAEMGGYTIPEAVYDYFHEDTKIHMWNNIPTGDVTSSAFRPTVKIADAFMDATIESDGGNADSMVRVTLWLDIPYKRLLRPRK